MSDYKILLKGSTVGFVTLVCSIFIAFLMMPFVIHSVGDRWYGLWVVIASILSFYGVMDLGLSSATQRFLSYALHQDNKVKLNQYFNSSLLIYLLISLIVLIVTALLVFFADSFVENKADLEVFEIIIAIMGGTLAVSFPFYVVNGILVANMRYDISALVSLAKIIIRAACIYAALNSGYGIIAMAVITSATDFLANIILTRYALKLAPWAKLDISFISRASIKELFSFGTYALISTTADKLRISAAPLIITYSLSLNNVTLYAIAAQFMSYFTQAISSLLVVVFPLFTKNISLNNPEKTRSDFVFSTKLSCIISSLGAIVITLLCLPFITIWMGDNYTASATAALILITGTAFVYCQQPSVQYLFAASKNKYHTWMLTFEAIATILIGFPLVKYYGINGMAFAVIAPQIFTKIFIQPKLICSLIDLNLFGYWMILIRQLVATLITISIFMFISFTENYILLLLMSFLIALTHSIISLFVVFSSADRAIIVTFISQHYKKNPQLETQE